MLSCYRRGLVDDVRTFRAANDSGFLRTLAKLDRLLQSREEPVIVVGEKVEEEVVEYTYVPIAEEGQKLTPVGRLFPRP